MKTKKLTLVILIILSFFSCEKNTKNKLIEENKFFCFTTDGKYLNLKIVFEVEYVEISDQDIFDFTIKSIIGPKLSNYTARQCSELSYNEVLDKISEPTFNQEILDYVSSDFSGNDNINISKIDITILEQI